MTAYMNVVTSRYVPAKRDDRSEGSKQCCPIYADRYLAITNSFEWCFI